MAKRKRDPWRGATANTRVHFSTKGRPYIIVNGKTRYVD
jgi:hypothetical protein